MTQIVGYIDTRRVFEDRFKLLATALVILSNGRKIRPTKGFIYDGGSIPSILYSIVGCPFGSLADWGFLVHDWLYYLSRLGVLSWTRLEADNAMLELHLFCGVDPIKAYGMYTIVRGASWKYWGNGDYDMEVEYNEDFLGL